MSQLLSGTHRLGIIEITVNKNHVSLEALGLCPLLPLIELAGELPCSLLCAIKSTMPYTIQGPCLS